MTRQSTEQFRTSPWAATTDRNGTISSTFRRLRILGFDEQEAGNLTAYVSGIAIDWQPWTVRELTHLFFLRELNRTGRHWSNADDRAAVDEDGRLSIGSKPPAADASDPLSLLRGMSGPGANLEHLATSGYRISDAIGDLDPEGG